MYTFQKEETNLKTLFQQYLALHPQKSILVYTFLNTGVAQYSIDVPPGVITSIHTWAADTETEHEDVGWQLWMDNAIIIPTLQQGAGGYEVPITGTSSPLVLTPNFPIYKDSKLTVSCNGLANLTSGFTVIIEYAEFPIKRSAMKTKEAIGGQKK